MDKYETLRELVALAALRSEKTEALNKLRDELDAVQKAYSAKADAAVRASLFKEGEILFMDGTPYLVNSYGRPQKCTLG